MSGLRLGRAARIALPLAVALVLCIVWDGAVRLTNSHGLGPAPSGIVATGWALTKSGIIVDAMSGSLKRVLIGFAIGGTLGIPVGLAIGTVAALDRMFRPVLDGLRSIAPIAWIPMAILWLGVRGDAALFVVAYGAAFPFIVNASLAARWVDHRLIAAARALGVNRWMILRAVLLPGAMPMIFTGARIALAFARSSCRATTSAISTRCPAMSNGGWHLCMSSIWTR